MLKFVMRFTYSNASWARMLQVPEDRAAAVSALLEHLQGSLEAIYWEVETASAFLITDIPDSVSAAAAITAAMKTGAFKDVQVHEVLTQDQFNDMITLAQSAEGVFRPPGSSAIEGDLARRAARIGPSISSTSESALRRPSPSPAGHVPVTPVHVAGAGLRPAPAPPIRADQ